MATVMFVGCGTDILEESVKKSDIRISGLSGWASVTDTKSNALYEEGYVFGCTIGFSVESFNEISGNIADWKLQIRGGGTTLLTIAPSNYSSYFEDTFMRLRVNAYKTSAVSLSKLSQERGCDRKYFSGKVPDTIMVTIHIEDDNGYSYTLEHVAPFRYDYNKDIIVR